MNTASRFDRYLQAYGSFNDWLIARRYQHFHRYYRGSSCLELGIATGAGIESLLGSFGQVTVVDASQRAVDKALLTYGDRGLCAIQGYFETMNFGKQRFDTIIMAHILEHVDDPVRVLRQARRFLAKNGTMIIDVPNADSLHRQVGVEMGLIDEVTDLNQADLSIGHQRVYRPVTLRSDLLEAGLEIEHFGGMFIKVTSGAQTEAVFSPEQLEAFFRVGLAQPDIAAEIYMIAS